MWRLNPGDWSGAATALAAAGCQWQPGAPNMTSIKENNDFSFIILEAVAVFGTICEGSKKERR